MKVLYLSYDGLTDPLGQSQILPYLQGLSSLGHQIHIISFEKKERFLDLGNTIQDICKQSKLHFHPQIYHKTPPIFSTIWDIFKMKMAAIKLHKQIEFELVHCRSYISAFVGLSLKKNQNIPWIFDMRGFYADERIDGNIWPQSKMLYRLVYRYFKNKELEFLKSANTIISLTSAAKATMIENKMVENNATISVIPCCVDNDHFNIENTDLDRVKQLKNSLGYEDHHIILGYVGSTGTWYLLESMFLYFKKLHYAKPNARFLILSHDNPKPILKVAEQLGIDRSTIQIVAVERIELPSFYALFNLSVFFIKSAFSKKASSPTKQGELMGMGIPIICNAGVGDTEDIILQYEAGLCLQSTSETELDKAVVATEEIIALNKERIIFGAKHYYSLKNGVKTLDSIYSQLAK